MHKSTVIYEGYGGGRCNCQFAHNYPFAYGPRIGIAYQIAPKTVMQKAYVDAIRRVAHASEIDAFVADWIAARPLADVMAVFDEVEVAAAPVYDAEQLLADPHLEARGTFVSVPDDELG